MNPQPQPGTGEAASSDADFVALTRSPGFWPIAGSTFVGIFAVPSYKYEDWHLLAAVPLGLVAGGLALITVVAIGAMRKLTAPLANRTILRSSIGGVVFGLVGVALPLTLSPAPISCPP